MEENIFLIKQKDLAVYAHNLIQSSSIPVSEMQNAASVLEFLKQIAEEQLEVIEYVRPTNDED